VRHRGGGGKSIGGRGAGCRRTRRSPAGRCGVEEATRGGGRGAHRWWGGARHSRKRCSLTGEAWGGGGRGVMSGSARSGSAGLGCVDSGVVGSIRRHEVGWVARGQTGGVGGAGARAGSVGWMREVRLVGWTVGFG
jgi:hypothetical protein